MGRWRLALGIAGVGIALYGVGRLLTGIPWSGLLLVGVWLVLALLIHDGVLSPAVVAVGVLLARIPARGRRYLQAGLIMAGLVTVITLPMIAQQGRQPPSKALLQQDFGANLMILLGIVAGACLVGYAVQVARDRTGSPRA